MEEKIWTTKDGKEIEISKMEDSHLLNAYNFLLKKTKNGVESKAQEYIGSGYDGDSYVPDFVWVKVFLSQKEALKLIPQFTWLEREIKRRKLLPNKDITPQ